MRAEARYKRRSNPASARFLIVVSSCKTLLDVGSTAPNLIKEIGDYSKLEVWN